MKSNKNRIEFLGLPYFDNLNEFSRQIHLSEDFLFRLFKFSSTFYKVYKIPKKNGGVRTISQPSKQMKAVQGWILREILDKLECHSASMGFEIGKSILDNALPHVGAKKLITIDLEDFFGTISRKQVRLIFKNIGYNNRVSDYLSRICTYNETLPQGGCTSPKLANLICKKMDERIQKLAENEGVIYTRYADDLSFSSPFDYKITHIIRKVQSIINDEGFFVNRKKLRIRGLCKKKTVTGLVIEGDKVGIGREKYRLIRSKINRLCIHSNHENKDINHLEGWLSFIYSVDKERYDRLKIYIHKLNIKYPNSSIKELAS